MNPGAVSTGLSILPTVTGLLSLPSVRALAEALALLTCAVAVATDLRSRTIPNRLTASSALCAVLVQALGGALGAGAWTSTWAPLLSGLLGGLVGLSLFSLLSLRGLVGFGDTKLIAALGLWLGLGSTLEIILYTLLAGGPLALLHGALQGQLGRATLNIVRGRVLAAPKVEEAAAHGFHPMPYGLAIALGTLWSVLAPRLGLPTLW